MKLLFDMGGTNLRAARATEDGIADIRKIRTPEDPQQALAALVALAQELSGGEAISVAAGGIAGVISQEGEVLMASPHLPAWKGFRFGELLSERLSARAVVRNDADAAALGEARWGAGAGARIVAYVGFGTGVGGGRVVHCSIDPYAYGFEPGHQVLDPATGRSFEEAVSGSALQKKHGVDPATLPHSAFLELLPIAATGLYNMVMHWSPDVLVVGGALVNDTNGFAAEEFAAAMEKLPQVFPRLPEVRAAKFGDASGLHGARALAMEQADRRVY